MCPGGVATYKCIAGGINAFNVIILYIYISFLTYYNVHPFLQLCDLTVVLLNQIIKITFNLLDYIYHVGQGIDIRVCQKKFHLHFRTIQLLGHLN